LTLQQVRTSTFMSLPADSLNDSLTGLLNLKSHRSDRAGVAPSSLVAHLSIGIQGFKSVNDSIDHDAGDAALKEYARLLSATTADTTIFESFTPYRIGGDGLAVLVCATSNTTAAAFYKAVEALAADIAQIEVHIDKKSGRAHRKPAANAVPTFLRVGVAPTWELADGAEKCLRTLIYMTVFGTLDVSGRTVAKGALDKGVANWTVCWTQQEDDALQADATKAQQTPPPPSGAEAKYEAALKEKEKEHAEKEAELLREKEAALHEKETALRMVAELERREKKLKAKLVAVGAQSARRASNSAKMNATASPVVERATPQPGERWLIERLGRGDRVSNEPAQVLAVGDGRVRARFDDGTVSWVEMSCAVRPAGGLGSWSWW